MFTLFVMGSLWACNRNQVHSRNAEGLWAFEQILQCLLQGWLSQPNSRANLIQNSQQVLWCSWLWKVQQVYSNLCNHWHDIINWQVTYENYCTENPEAAVHDVSRQQALPNLIHCVCHSSPQTLHTSSSHVGYMYEGSGGKASVTHALILSLFTC